MVGQRYYSPELCRFIQPADVSSLNPSSINGLNLYSYANNNPIGIVYSNSSVGGTTSSGMVNSLTLGESIVPGGLSINKGYYWPNLDFLGTGFGYIENTFSMIAGVIDGYRKIKHLKKISGLEVASDWLMGIGMFINAGLSVYDNFIYPNNLSLNEKLGNVTGEVAYILVSSGITYGVGYLTTLIPFVGPFIAPITSLLSGIVLDQIWTGEDILWIKGWSIKVNDKSLEEWFKDVLTEWFGG